ncbi:hypothetical protein A1O3_03566 [Capronia epimyces CBS 606.96]|uniref:Uncharacterized protein n=1 Tax=Capronia epimyces CBS 606.96 TaxID=1182542 RepID=W9Y285_9EURO|nr:uncharacterized protein A1O3_03566 [Capronia epimyces CBS 606.96]EXJ86613.1 hypothetical protein A1O3_03566 [Capronia epimyces CBS 606.96]
MATISAACYQRVICHGALYVGKVNLGWLATGLMPAGFNGVVGFKPTRGLVSFAGVTPRGLAGRWIPLPSPPDDARPVWHLRLVKDTTKMTDTHETPSLLNDTSIRWVVSVTRSGPDLVFHHPGGSRGLFAYLPQVVRGSCATLAQPGRDAVTIDWTSFHVARKLLCRRSWPVCQTISWRRTADTCARSSGSYLIFAQVVARQSTAVELFRDLRTKATNQG